MAEGQYSTRELEHYFGDIRKDIKEIKEQTIKTNGRVNKLENWRWLLTGGMLIISMMVIPLLVYIFNSVVNSPIDKLTKILSNYEVTVEK